MKNALASLLVIGIGLLISMPCRAVEKCQFITNLEAGNNQVIVTYGTSLTAEGGWVGGLQDALNKRYPGKATVINSGGSGKWSEWGVANLKERVLKNKPDAVFIEFSMNDSVARFNATVEMARANLESMITSIHKQNPRCEIILMTMTPGNGHPVGHFSHRKDIGKHYEMVRAVAKAKGLLLIDHDPNWRALQSKDPEQFKKWVPDTIHATDEGCDQVVTPLILSELGLVKASQASKPPKPNIIILYADDLGYGDLGCYNPESKIPTPNLDKLAATGTRFTDGHSSSGVCTPSRYALLTGRHHWRDFHGIVDSLGKSVFKKEQLTLPEMLRENGYSTAAIGKWHLGWDWDAIRKPGTKRNSIRPADFDWTKPIPDGPLAHGFDHYFGDDVINFPPYAWIENDRLPRAPDSSIDEKFEEPSKEGTWNARPGPALSGWDFYKVLPTLTDKTVEWVRSRKGNGQPYFLYVPFPSPHAPIIPNDEFDGKSKAGPYGDFVYQTDDACGRILKALDESGHAENTIVIFTADNGAEIYAYERDQKYGHWSSAPFRGVKRDIYEGGHHVPFIIRWPGVTKAGGVSDALISQVDLMATFAAAIGAGIPEGQAIDSFNFLPYMKGEPKAPRTQMVHNTQEEKYAFRDGDWLLINTKTGAARPAPDEWNKKHNYPADSNTPVQLFNLREDIGQRHNLAAKHPERVDEMKKLLEEVRASRYPGLK